MEEDDYKTEEQEEEEVSSGEEELKQEYKQVMRGHNIVADGWAGASNPIHTPNPTLSHANIHKTYQKCSFLNFSTRSPRTDGRTDGWTNGRTKPLIELRVRN